MVQKRGGHLCAPIPRGSIGNCGYLNDMPYELLKSSLAEYKQVCLDFPRQGLGKEMHCADVGLEDPSVTAKAHVRNEKSPQIQAQDSTEPKTSYQEWIQQAQVSRNANWEFNVSLQEAKDTKNPPIFDKVSFKMCIFVQLFSKLDHFCLFSFSFHHEILFLTGDLVPRRCGKLCSQQHFFGIQRYSKHCH